MKIFLKTAVLLLWLTITSNAQSPRKGEEPAKATAEIPTMQEWWRADGISDGRGISYLPNFKDGRDALAVSLAYDKIHTWMNTFPGDTQNVFTWADDSPALFNRTIRYGDFNGDGIRDYIAPHGFIYRGIQNGQPPETKYVKQYFVGDILGVFDFNLDGFDDVYGEYGIVYGGSDLSALVRTPVPQGIFDENRTFSALYQTAQGELRFIVQNTKAKAYDGYELYRAAWEKGGTQPVFVKLDSIRQHLFSMKDFFYISGQQALYQSKKNGKPYLIVRESIDGNWNNIIRTNIVIFDLSGDKFAEHLKFRIDSISLVGILEHSIDGDEYEDWYLVNRQSKCLFFSGGEKLDSIPRMKAPNFQMGSLVSIEDISGDGVNDIAIGYYIIGIVKGIDLTTGVVTNLSESGEFSLSEPIPQPITSIQQSFVEVSVPQVAEYTLSLYSIEGKQVTQIFKGQLENGEHRFPLNFASYNVSHGSYILRLSTGSQSVERTIIITN